jgi:nucleoid-associated protein YgaU
MGRETKFLLAVLGVLGGAFVGVLSMKLLVPRPPAGAGPDVDPQEQIVATHDIVEPPALEPRANASAFTAKRDPFVARTASAEPLTGEPAEAVEPPDFVADAPPAAEVDPPPAAPRKEPADLLPPATFPARETSVPLAKDAPIAGTHITAPGDTWWSIAERAYGDGRLYRALYAWNRRLDPRVSTAPGTRLEIPPQPRLAAAWPRLMPEIR